MVMETGKALRALNGRSLLEEYPILWREERT